MSDLELIVSGKPKIEGRDFPTIAEIELLRTVIKEKYGSKDSFIADLILSTGLLPQEMVGLNYGDFGQDRLEIKEGKKRIVFFAEEFYAHFKKYTKSTEHQPGEPLFTSNHGRMTSRAVKKSIKRIITKAGINSSYSSKSLRYAQVYHLYHNSDLDIAVVHAQLGTGEIQFQKKAAESIETRAKTALKNLYEK